MSAPAADPPDAGAGDAPAVRGQRGGRRRGGKRSAAEKTAAAAQQQGTAAFAAVQQAQVAQLRQQLATLQVLQQGGAPYLEASIAEIQARIACLDAMTLQGADMGAVLSPSAAPKEAPLAAPPEPAAAAAQRPPALRASPPDPGVAPETRTLPASAPALLGQPAAPQAGTAAEGSVSTVPTQRPCAHNSWDNVRTKKGQVFLRCRDCDAQWRTAVDGLNRCHAFASAAGCSAGAACPMMHLHSRKQSLEERVERHGHVVLDRVPVSTHPDGRLPDERARGGNSCGTSQGGDTAAEATDADSAAAAPAAPLPPPCAHNSWDNVRMKKGQVFLRCRECEAQWRVGSDFIDRCAAFISPGGCPAGAACSQLHLHPRKQSLGERLARHGPAVLDKIATAEPLTVTLSKTHGGSIGATVKGATVTRVVDGSPADAAGLRIGMRVVAVCGNPVGAATTDVVTAVRSAWAESNEMTLTVCALPREDGGGAREAHAASPAPPAGDPAGAAAVSFGTSPGGPPPLEDAASFGGSSAASAAQHDVQRTVCRQRSGELLGLSVRGALITKVAPGSAAAGAGITEDMRLLAVNGASTGSTTAEVVTALRAGWEQGELHMLLRPPGLRAQHVEEDDLGSQPGTPTEQRPAPPASAGGSSGVLAGDSTAGAAAVQPQSCTSDAQSRPRLLSSSDLSRLGGASDGAGGAGTAGRSCGSGAGSDPGEGEFDVPLVVVKCSVQDSFGASVKGNLVTRVQPGSSAAIAGMEAGMRILSVNGRTLRATTVDVVTAIRACWKSAPSLEMELVVRTSPALTLSDWDGCSSANLSAFSEAHSGSRCSSPLHGTSPSPWGEVGLSGVAGVVGSPCPEQGALSTPPAPGGMLYYGAPSACVAPPPPEPYQMLPFTVCAAGQFLPWQQVPIAAGGPAWVDRTYYLSSIPARLLGAVSYRGPYKSVARGTPHTVFCGDPLELYVIHALALGRDGGFPHSLPPLGWDRCDDAPRWQGGPVSRLGMALWHRRVHAGETVSIPPTATPETTMIIAAARPPLRTTAAGCVTHQSSFQVTAAPTAVAGSAPAGEQQQQQQQQVASAAQPAVGGVSQPAPQIPSGSQAATFPPAGGAPDAPGDSQLGEGGAPRRRARSR